MSKPKSHDEDVTVLIVEDEPTTARLLREGMERDPALTVSARTSPSLASALTALGSEAFDLIILDLGLPDSGGVTTLERVKQAAPETPVVVLTGLDDHAIGARCIEMGAQNYLVKGCIGSAISGVLHNTMVAKAALRQVEVAHENLKHVLDSSFDAILVIEDGGEVKFANRTARALFGNRVSEGQNIGLLLESGEMLELDVPLFDGSFAQVEMRAGKTTWFDEPARIVSFRDVTERATAAASLRSSEAMLVDAQETARIGSWQYDVAMDRAHWSREMFRIFGLDPTAAGPSWADHRQIIHPEDWERIDTAVRAAIEKGIPYREEIRVVHEDGEVLWVETIGRALQGESGATVQLSGTVQDITERVTAAAELKEQQHLFEIMFNTIPDGVVITDTERRILLANQGMTKTFGYHPADLLGRTTELLYATKTNFQDAGSTIFGQQFGQGGDLYITRYKKADGTEFSGETFGTKLHSEQGEWIGNLGIMRDITEREQAEQQMTEQLDELRRWHKLTLGRESRVVELKREVNELLAKAGQALRYEEPSIAECGVRSADDASADAGTGRPEHGTVREEE